MRANLSAVAACFAVRLLAAEWQRSVPVAAVTSDETQAPSRNGQGACFLLALSYLPSPPFRL